MNSQSKATEKWQKKTGWMSKSYKLRKDLVDQFVAACKKNGDSQASILMESMKKYIEEKGA